MVLGHACITISMHPGKILSTGEGDRTLKTLLLRQVRIPVPSLLQKIPPAGIEPAKDPDS